MHLDKSILIRARPEEVYAWLAPHRQPAWDPTLVRATELTRPPAPPGPLRFVRVARAFGHRFESHAEATREEAARAFAWRQLEGDFEEHRGAYTLRPGPGGSTWLHLVADVEFPYVMPEVVTEAQLRHILSDGADEALLRLKELVERPRGAA